MREIKFRAWWKHPIYLPQGKMYFVGGLLFAEKQECEPEYDNFGNAKEVGLMEYKNNSKIGWNNANECILMQFTGLNDKNGKDIYEGDILQDDEKHVEPFAVEWNDMKEYTNWYSSKGNVFEIIGNIYENPELLK